MTAAPSPSLIDLCVTCGRGDYGAENYTHGEWQTEMDSTAALDDRLARLSSLFKVYKEVRGHYPQPRLGAPEATARIDRVLMPTQRLYDLGWRLGPVGVECKKSGVKVGPPYSQLLDYSRAIWTLDPERELHIALKWLFLWPFGKTFGPFASILTQHRLGGLDLGRDAGSVVFWTAGQRIAEFNDAGDLLNAFYPASGNKVGSR